MVRVVNKHTHTPQPNDIYIGRGSVLGNSFTSISDRPTQATTVVASREESVASYNKRLIELMDAGDPHVIDALRRIYEAACRGDVNLVCFCAPRLCHGDAIARAINFIISKN